MDKIINKPLYFIILSVGFIWARSSLAKFTSGNFVSNLGETLTKAAAKNPYPFYKQFLTDVAIPNSQIFGFLVFWGEVLVAVSIILGAVIFLKNPKPHKLIKFGLVAGLASGVFLNITYWLGFGYTSPATDSLNLLMTIAQISGIFFVKRL